MNIVLAVCLSVRLSAVQYLSSERQFGPLHVRNFYVYKYVYLSVCLPSIQWKVVKTLSLNISIYICLSTIYLVEGSKDTVFNYVYPSVCLPYICLVEGSQDTVFNYVYLSVYLPYIYLVEGSLDTVFQYVYLSICLPYICLVEGSQDTVFKYVYIHAICICLSAVYLSSGRQFGHCLSICIYICLSVCLPYIYQVEGSLDTG